MSRLLCLLSAFWVFLSATATFAQDDIVPAVRPGVSVTTAVAVDGIDFESYKHVSQVASDEVMISYSNNDPRNSIENLNAVCRSNLDDGDGVYIMFDSQPKNSTTAISIPEASFLELSVLGYTTSVANGPLWLF